MANWWGTIDLSAQKRDPIEPASVVPGITHQWFLARFLNSVNWCEGRSAGFAQKRGQTPHHTCQLFGFAQRIGGQPPFLWKAQSATLAERVGVDLNNIALD